jgi:hypothetical protein
MNMEHWWDVTDRENRNYSEKKILRYRHFVHHKSHKHWPGNYLGLCDERPVVNSLIHGRPSQQHYVQIQCNEFHLDRK